MEWLDTHRSDLSFLRLHCGSRDSTGICASSRSRRKQTRPLPEDNQAFADNLRIGPLPRGVSLLSLRHHSNTGCPGTSGCLLSRSFIDLSKDTTKDASNNCRCTAGPLLPRNDSRICAGMASRGSKQRGKPCILHRPKSIWSPYLVPGKSV